MTDDFQFPPPEAYAHEVLEQWQPMTVQEPARRPSIGGIRIIWGNQIPCSLSPNWIIKGLIENGSIFAIYGAPKSGKTFAALDLAMHVAAGCDWFGKKVKRSGLVVYVAAEGVVAVQRRIRAHAVRNRVNQSDLGRIAIVCGVVNLTHSASVDELITEIQQAAAGRKEKPVMVILDTLARVVAGAEENSAKDMSLAISACDRIRDELNVAVGFVHHAGKDAAKGMRGSTALSGGVDLTLAVTRDPGTKLSRIAAQEQREGDNIFAATFTLDPVDLGQDDDGDAIVSCVVVPSTSAARSDVNRATLSAVVNREREILADCVARHGRRASVSDSHIPIGAVVVTEDEWRAYHYARSPGGTQESKQKGFKRAEARLLEGGIAAKWGQFVWLVQPDTPDNVRDVSGPVRMSDPDRLDNSLRDAVCLSGSTDASPTTIPVAEVAK